MEPAGMARPPSRMEVAAWALLIALVRAFGDRSGHGGMMIACFLATGAVGGILVARWRGPGWKGLAALVAGVVFLHAVVSVLLGEIFILNGRWDYPVTLDLFPIAFAYKRPNPGSSSPMPGMLIPLALWGASLGMAIRMGLVPSTERLGDHLVGVLRGVLAFVIVAAVHFMLVPWSGGWPRRSALPEEPGLAWDLMGVYSFILVYPAFLLALLHDLFLKHAKPSAGTTS
ncbi:MAG: hypothetical protein KIS92_09490 [Planctomycetota bacterium]|nr:hypothetical protein [Planctomycetota bacterium]